MKRKFISAVIITAFTVCILSAAIPAAAMEGSITRSGNINWLDISNRQSDQSGVKFVLEEFIQHVERADEGLYSFEITVENSLPGRAVAYKIETQGGSRTAEDGRSFGNFVFVNTESDPLIGVQTLVTYGSNLTGPANTPTEGMVEADEIYNRALLRQNIGFWSFGQNPIPPFRIHNIIVKHELDGVEKIIYDMSKDPVIQNLAPGEIIETGEYLSMGLMLTGSAIFMTYDSGVPLGNGTPVTPDPGPEDPPPADPDGEGGDDPVADPDPDGGDDDPADDPAPEEKPADKAKSSTTSLIPIGLIALTVVLLIGTSGWAFMLSKG